jgi:hypothetical protein
MISLSNCKKYNQQKVFVRVMKIMFLTTQSSSTNSTTALHCQWTTSGDALHMMLQQFRQKLPEQQQTDIVLHHDNALPHVTLCFTFSSDKNIRIFHIHAAQI